jgi:Flp pilus assembly pilin Flp
MSLFIHFLSFMRRFSKDDCGQSTTEYILILAVVVMVAMKFKTVFQDKLIGAVETMGGQIQSAVQQTN